MISRLRLADENSRQMGIVLAGHAIRLGLGLVSSALLARALGPARLSVFSVLGAAMMIAITIADLGLSEGAVRYIAGDLADRPERARQLGRLFVGLKLLGGTAVVLLFILFSDPLLALLGLPPTIDRSLVWLAGAGVLATTFSGVIASVLQALRRFTALFSAQTLNVSLTVILMGLLFLAGRLTIAAALVVGAVTALAAGLLGWRLLPADWRWGLLGPFGKLRAGSFGKLRTGSIGKPFDELRTQRPSLRGPELARLWRFSRWLWLSTFMAIVLAQLDLLMLNRLSTPRQAGFYALALNLALKAELLQQTMRIVLLPSVSMLRPGAFGAYIRRSLGRSLALVALLALAVPLARPFIVAVYGPDFAPAADALILLLGVVAFDLLTLPLLLLAFPLDAPRLIAAANAVRLAAMLLAGSWLIPAGGMTGAAAAKLVAKVLGALFLGAALVIRLRRGQP